MIISEYFKNIGKNPYISFLFVIVVVKIIFMLSSIGILIVSKITSLNDHIDRVTIFRDHIYHIFTFLVSVLLIYLFNPYKNRDYLLDKETKILIYLYGWISILFLIKRYITLINTH
jgi:hypothetical protein